MRVRPARVALLGLFQSTSDPKAGRCRSPGLPNQILQRFNPLPTRRPEDARAHKLRPVQFTVSIHFRPEGRKMRNALDTDSDTDTVSIHFRPEGRKMHQAHAAAGGDVEFQSTSDPQVGRCRSK